MKLFIYIVIAGTIAFISGGMLGYSFAQDKAKKPEKLCIQGEVVFTQFFDPLMGKTSFIGQQIICAENWELSPAFGPDIETWIEKGMQFDKPTDEFGGNERIEAEP